MDNFQWTVGITADDEPVGVVDDFIPVEHKIFRKFHIAEKVRKLYDKNREAMGLPVEKVPRESKSAKSRGKGKSSNTPAKTSNSTRKHKHKETPNYQNNQEYSLPLLHPDDGGNPDFPIIRTESLETSENNTLLALPGIFSNEGSNCLVPNAIKATSTSKNSFQAQRSFRADGQDGHLQHTSILSKLLPTVASFRKSDQSISSQDSMNSDHSDSNVSKRTWATNKRNAAVFVIKTERNKNDEDSDVSSEGSTESIKNAVHLKILAKANSVNSVVGLKQTSSKREKEKEEKPLNSMTKKEKQAAKFKEMMAKYPTEFRNNWKKLMIPLKLGGALVRKYKVDLNFICKLIL